ncbi:hypothetical protein EUGRSUZ_F00217 [Eucalyptus grandis]|uniref:Uncharacterized protein n=2 Tax=Eucalyptus grandis TaxID=71139 RepID=A0ACC3KAE6_EUCGR|nr:hypothetical protein EUGRSUZ_F00217 [Eucalyptus grandis]
MRGNLTKSMGDLVHLRYLSLVGSAFEGLPQSMGNLICMDVLDLQGNLHVRVTVPNVLWKIRRSMHLHLPFNFAIKEKF